MDDIVKKSCKGYLLKAIDGEETGIIEAIVSVYGVEDLAGDIVDVGAFDESIAAMMPKSCVNHDWSKGIGLVLAAKSLAPGDPLLPEDIREQGGLYTKTQYVREHTESWQMYIAVKSGLMAEFSIGALVTKRYKGPTGATHIKTATLIEVSNCLMGVNTQTKVLSVKSALPFMDHGPAVKAEFMGYAERVLGRLDVKEAAGRTYSSETDAYLMDFIDTLQSKLKEMKDRVIAARKTNPADATTKSNANRIAIAQAYAQSAALCSPIPIGIN